ncbi:transcriptional regulator [Frateuria sp. Soil773]|uniref:helix-turn-helix transcriptional regulator n=1 Tax=Frateuria sp. Soil773 TaxID=1736407 RepID=UPI0006F8311D|nr:YafY family protein [Frateuria sp. Soil773]KRE89534.1 transcriptional regulator [Frateuria sp. Soil773]
MALPTTRVLAVLDLLQSHGRMSGPELARRVGVDVRTLRRYIVMLEDLGIPLTTERGRHGAYMLVAGFRLPPMMFTNDEAVALSVGMVAARGLGLAEAAPAVESAQAKLARVMPDGLKRHVRAIAGTVKVDLRHAPNTPGSNAALIALTAAAQAQQRVRMDYVSSQGAPSERSFDPYGLAYWAGGWYAVGWCHLRGDLRSFRLDRVGEVVALGLPFRRPAGFDALDHLLRSIAAVPRAHAIEVRLRTDLRSAREAFPLVFGLLEPVDGGVLLRSSADDLGWFARQLAGLRFDFEIRAPDLLRTELARCAARLHALAAAGS